MSKPKLYECKPCLQTFKGRKLYDYHMRGHRRMMTAAEREALNTTSEGGYVVSLEDRPTGADTDKGETLWT